MSSPERLRLLRFGVALACASAGTASPGPLSALTTQDARVPVVVPRPVRMDAGPGRFTIDADTRIGVSQPALAALRDLAEYLAVPLRAASGFPLPVLSRAPSAAESNLIVLRLPADAVPDLDTPYDWADREPENYSLDVSPDRITLAAPSAAGLFRGLQTLRQLLPPEFEDGYAATHGRAWRSDESVVFGANRTPRQPLPMRGAPAPVRAAPVPSPDPDAARAGSSTVDWSIPTLSIEDQPRFAWRGMHLDVGRHMFPPAFIRKYIDLIAAQRMNVFHWHLTEDQGWRIEIARYPRLTRVSAFRDETILERSFDPYIGDGIPYGGFYTQAEIRDIVDYAASRYVTIVPEIEMPGHSVAVLAAYPELGCSPGPFEVATVWGVKPDIYCPHERTFEFLENVLDEVMDLFPGRYIHVGGDEAPKTAWEESDVAQAVIRREGLADEDELQSWFIRRIERFLNGNGRRLIGWDEILEGGLAPEATVMSWRGMQGGIDAARQGHDVVMTPTSHAYFDYYQGDPAHEPLAIGGFLPLDRVYSFEPVPVELSPEEARHVLGAQGNVWTEYVKTADHVEYMAMPRMLALAEVVWSPAAARDWSDFVRRLPRALDRLRRLDVDYRVPDVAGLETDRLTLGDTVRVALSAPLVDAVIRYTLDGTEPAPSSAVYTTVLTLPVDSGGVTVSARAFTADGRVSGVASARFAKASLRLPDRTDGAGLAAGLRYEYFEGSFRSADAVRTMRPARAGVASEIRLQGGEREERFALRFKGFFHAPADGIYTFTLSSDDGSRLRIGDRLVVDHDGPHGTSARDGQVALAAGWHGIEVTYFQAGGGLSLDVEVAGPGLVSARVPADRLAHPAGETGPH